MLMKKDRLPIVLISPIYVSVMTFIFSVGLPKYTFSFSGTENHFIHFPLILIIENKEIKRFFYFYSFGNK